MDYQNEFQIITKFVKEQKEMIIGYVCIAAACGSFLYGAYNIARGKEIIGEELKKAPKVVQEHQNLTARYDSLKALLPRNKESIDVLIRSYNLDSTKCPKEAKEYFEKNVELSNMEKQVNEKYTDEIKNESFKVCARIYGKSYIPMFFSIPLSLLGAVSINEGTKKAKKKKVKE